jgi:hypothetical protein
VLEPWLERLEDLSALLRVEPGAPPLLLGSARQRLAGSGLYRGHEGWVDARGRVGSGSPNDEALREAAVLLAGAAADAGYAGPCGLDAFAFRAPDGSRAFRPVVELNARFTAGCVALGWVRRALPEAAARLGLEPGGRLAFRFELDAGPAEPGPGLHRVDLAAEGESLRPALVFARDASSLESRPRRES